MRKIIFIGLSVLLVLASVLSARLVARDDYISVEDGQVYTGLPVADDASVTGTPVINETIGAPGTGAAATPLTLTVSEPGHFHSQEITVTITASNPDARIYYSLDGSVPTIGSMLHDTPLTFRAMQQTRAVTLRAIAVYGNNVSAPFTHTYFIGRNVDDRFDTLIFSLSSDPKGLFDHDIGIFVPGRLREEFIRDNPGRNIVPPDPANFNMRGREAERATTVEVFTPDGERVIFQEAGIRTHGGWSRAEEQKSIRVIARRDYSPDYNRFHFDFFPGDAALDGSNVPITQYQTLILRNGGNDRNFGMLRNEVGSVLLRNTGHYVVTPVRPVAVFLNGVYWGFAWLQVRMNDRYLQDLFNAPTRAFDNVGMGERWIDSDCPYIRKDMRFMNSFAYRDLTNDEIFADLEAIVDIDNLLFYYAFQIFMGSEDWPHNNLRRWRYTGEQVPGLAPELDGRWRYIFFDLDWTLGLYGDNFRKPTFQRVLEGNNPRSPLLANILTRQDMADRFTMIMCDIAANVVNHYLVSNVIDELFGIAENEISHALAARRHPRWVNTGSIRDNHNEMLNFARRRHEFIFQNLVDFFGFDAGMFSVSVSGGEAIIGTQQGTFARYFNHLTIPVKPVLPELYAFDHWIVNGERVYEAEITVSAADAVKGAVVLELVVRGGQ